MDTLTQDALVKWAENIEHKLAEVEAERKLFIAKFGDQAGHKLNRLLSYRADARESSRRAADVLANAHIDDTKGEIGGLLSADRNRSQFAANAKPYHQ